MIAIAKANGEYRPVILCDQCGERITDAANATVVCSSAPEGKTAQLFHVHKGVCDDALAARVEGLFGSEELTTHLIELIKNTFTPDDLSIARRALGLPFHDRGD